MRYLWVALLALGCASDPAYRTALDEHGEKVAERHGRLDAKIDTVALGVSTNLDGLVEIEKGLSAAVQERKGADAKFDSRLAKEQADVESASHELSEQLLGRIAVLDTDARARSVRARVSAAQDAAAAQARDTVALNEIQALKGRIDAEDRSIRLATVERASEAKAQDARLDALENAPPLVPAVRTMSDKEKEALGEELWDDAAWGFIFMYQVNNYIL